MDNDIDLLETNRFINVDIIDQDVSFLNTSDRYLDFLKKTGNSNVNETLEDDLLALDTIDDEQMNDIDTGKISNNIIDKQKSFAHSIENVFSIDSRFRNTTANPNAYKIQIFLEKEFSFLDLIELIDIHIPHVSNVSGMNESNSSSPVPYLFMRLKIDSFPDNILNTITTPITVTTASSAASAVFLEKRDSTVSIFAKIGLSIRNDNAKIYNRIIYGSKDFNDTLSVVRAASSVTIEILGMNGSTLDSTGLSPAFSSNNGNNWNMTIRFVEKIQLLKSLNVNSIRSVNIDPRALETA